jgi:hypothetical protein
VSQLAGAPRAPYSLRPVAFSLPALAAMGARAPLGGPRETALACLMVGRLAADLLDGAQALALDVRKTRAHGARQWLSGTTLAPLVRAALVRLADATAAERTSAVADALDSVMTVTANQLDPAARLELGRLAQALAE